MTLDPLLNLSLAPHPSVYSTRWVNIAPSLRSRQTQEKIKGLWQAILKWKWRRASEQHRLNKKVALRKIRIIIELFCNFTEEIEKRNSEQSFETAEIRATLKSLDRERDDLQQQVDEKTEEIMNLEAKKIQSV